MERWIKIKRLKYLLFNWVISLLLIFCTLLFVVQLEYYNDMMPSILFHKVKEMKLLIGVKYIENHSIIRSSISLDQLEHSLNSTSRQSSSTLKVTCNEVAVERCIRCIFLALLADCSMNGGVSLLTVQSATLI